MDKLDKYLAYQNKPPVDKIKPNGKLKWTNRVMIDVFGREGVEGA